jgi:hypothetical protein
LQFLHGTFLHVPTPRRPQSRVASPGIP